MQRNIWQPILRRSIITGACCVFSTVGITLGQETAPTSLTWENYGEVDKYIQLKPADENYQKISWHSTVLTGQRKAQAEDKPLLLWLYFGDPRGNC
jgi:hypothetical protein